MAISDDLKDKAQRTREDGVFTLTWVVLFAWYLLSRRSVTA
jgi:hypothetical protein